MTDPDRYRFAVAARALPVAEVCPEAAWLARLGAPMEVWREGMRFGLAGPAQEGAYNAYRRMMSDVVALHVSHAVSDIQDDIKVGVIPEVAVLAPSLTSTPYGPIEGTLIKDGAYIEGKTYTRPRGGDFDIDITGSVDHAWVNIPGDGGAGPVAVVLQHELSRYGLLRVDSLDMAFYGLAWAAARNCDRMILGRCYHSPTKPPIYEWTPVIEEAAMTQYWERCRRALMRPHEAAPGDHCERCPVRATCAQWQYPILIDGTTTLKTLTGNLTSETYPKLKGLIGAMKHVLGVAEAKLRTFEREGRG